MTVKELLSGPEKWVKSYLAINKNGFPVPEDSPDAVAWCLGGAMIKIYGGIETGHEAWGKLKNAILEVEDQTIIGFNDTHRYEEVMAAVEKAGI